VNHLDAMGAEHHAPRAGLVGALESVLGRDPHAACRWEGRMGRKAVEDEYVAGLVVAVAPRLEPPQGRAANPRVLAAGQDGQPPSDAAPPPGGPSSQHVLDAR